MPQAEVRKDQAALAVAAAVAEGKSATSLTLAAATNNAQNAAHKLCDSNLHMVHLRSVLEGARRMSHPAQNCRHLYVMQMHG